MSEIWAIILAAGESMRMGFPKMLLPLKGTTVVERVIQNVISSQVDGTVVVLGAYRDEITRVVRKWPVKICVNEHYKEGMLSSVKSGFSFLPDQFGAALVFPGDQPSIGPEIAGLLVSAFRASGKGIVVPVFRKKRGHPLLIAGSYRDEVMLLNNEEGLKGLTGKFPEDVLEVEAGTDKILKDIDTQEDYLNELNKKQ